MSDKEISISDYNKRCDKIIKQGKDIDETLIELLDMAGKFTIKRGSPKSKRRKDGYR